MTKILLMLFVICSLTFSTISEAKVRHNQKSTKHNVNSPNVNARIVMIFDEQKQKTLFDKNPNKMSSIASITKLMTAMVVLDANLPKDELVYIGKDDIKSKLKSRLKIGDKFTREEMIQIMLISSENRAALALSKAYPGGLPAFVKAMNDKCAELGMEHSQFFEPTGLDRNNMSTANDLVKMVIAASSYPEIHKASTTSSHLADVEGRKSLMYHNTNQLVNSDGWDIIISKTGYISQSGQCIVMQTMINDNPVIIVILHSRNKFTRVSDAKQIKKWAEKQPQLKIRSEVKQEDNYQKSLLSDPGEDLVCKETDYMAETDSTPPTVKEEIPENIQTDNNVIQ